MNCQEFTVELEADESVRCDKYVSDILGLLSRSQLKSRNAVLRFTVSANPSEVDGKALKWSRKIINGDQMILEWEEPPAMDLKPEKVDFGIIYEDDDVLVVDKPQGLVVHPAHGHYSGTLVHGLLYHGLVESDFPDTSRPGIVHRLDMDTSGVMITAKHGEALEFLSRQFRESLTDKRYMAICQGNPPQDQGTIETYIARDVRDRKKYAVHNSQGKWAVSSYEVLDSSRNFSLVSLGLKTGRTHQLRVHMKSLGCSIAGDPIYGKKDKLYPDCTLMLHAWRLKIMLPCGRKQTFYSYLPQRFTDLLESEQISLPEDRKLLKPIDQISE